MTDKLLVSFKGGHSEEHKLRALEGGRSLAGIGLGVTRIAHYLSTGEVRYRAPYSERVGIFLTPPRAGSIEFDIVTLLATPAPTTLIGQVLLNLSAPLVLGLVTYLFQRVTGVEKAKAPESLQRLVVDRSGDLDALAVSVEAPVLQAHSVIGNGATIIHISGNGNTVNLDESSREYMKRSVLSDSVEAIDGSVGRLNINDRSGGLFVKTENRVIPFDVAESASIATIKVLLESMSLYAAGQESDVQVHVYKTFSTDGRIKKFLVMEAKQIERE